MIVALSGAWTIGKRALRAYLADKAMSFAAAIAYHALFSLFPLSLFAIGVGGYFMTKGQRAQLVRGLADALGAPAAGNIQRQINLVTNGRAGISLIGLVIALWSASALFGAIRTGLGVVWKYERHRRWYTAKLQDLASVIAFGALLALSLSGTIAATALNVLGRKLLGAHLGELAAVAFGAVFFFLPATVTFFTFGFLYAITSPRGVHWRTVWPGALVAGVGFQAVSLGFSVYVRSFGRFDKVYGSLGAVIAFLFYAYLVASLILLGGEIAHQYALWQASRLHARAVADNAPLPFMPRPRRYSELD